MYDRFESAGEWCQFFDRMGEEGLLSGLVSVSGQDLTKETFIVGTSCLSCERLELVDS